MSYVPGFQYDVFFSYATVDNVPSAAKTDNTGWVSRFRTCLMASVDRKLGRRSSASDFFDHQDLASNSPLTRSLEDALRSSAVFVAINSMGFLDPACACRQECTRFLEVLGATPEERRDQRRVWIVHIDDVPRVEWQAVFFPDVRGKAFFLHDPETNVVRLLPRGDNLQPFMDLVDDLASEIAARLKEMKAKVTPGPQGVVPVPRTSLGNIFLAETFGDPFGERRRLKKFFEEAGYTVLPKAEYPDATYLEDLRAGIENSLAFVQLLGPEPWKPGGYDVIQYRIASEARKPLFRWRSPETDLTSIDSASHRAFLAGDDVTASAMEDFRRKLITELSRLSLRRAPVAPLAILVRYAVRPEDSVSLGQHVQAKLSHKGFLFEELTLAESFTTRYRTEPCQGFMLLCSGASHGTTAPGTLRERISECRQIQMALKEPDRMPALGVIYWPPPDDFPLPSSALKMHMIHSARDPEWSAFLQEVANVKP